LNLTASTVAGATYAWTGPNGFTSSTQNPTIPSATTAATGTYSVMATVNGCTSAAGTTATTVKAIPSAPTAGNNGPVCPGATLNLTASTVSGATYAWTGPNGFTAAVQNPTRTSVTTAATGTYSVTATVNGCTSTAGTTAATVVNDTTPPTITCPADVTVSVNAGCTAINVVLGSAVTGDNCSVASVVNNAPVVYPLGTNVVTWTVTDGSGNTNSCTQRVVVRDTTPPTFTGPANVIIDL
jgi:hypothetical protein